MSPRTEKIYVLFGTQTGNSEQAAQELCSQMPTKLSAEAIQQMTGTSEEINVQPICKPLDDFLEIDLCQWTRLTVIITSSYGIGQAPLGCYRFRELCDEWHQRYKDNAEAKILQGLYFAMCGLGDSKYTTYFQNPTKIDDTLRLLGMERVGPLGKADASGNGNDLQAVVIERWMEGIWTHLAQVLSKPHPSDDFMAEKQRITVEVCRKINPDFLPAKKSGPPLMLLALLVALLAIAAFYIIQS